MKHQSIPPSYVDFLNVKSAILIFLLSMFSFSESSGQEPEKVSSEKEEVLIYTVKGKQYQGTIISKSDTELILKTSNGEIEFLMENVKFIENVGPREFDYTSYLRSRYAVTSSTIPTKETGLYYQNIWLIHNSLGYRLTKKISFEGGGVPYNFNRNSGTISSFIPHHFIVRGSFRLSKRIFFGADLAELRLIDSESVFNSSLASFRTTLVFKHAHFSGGIFHTMNISYDSKYRNLGNFSAFISVSDDWAFVSDNWLYQERIVGQEREIEKKWAYSGFQGLRIIGDKASATAAIFLNYKTSEEFGVSFLFKYTRLLKLKKNKKSIN